jgi:alkanesulfonate monooxygenase SsuD/methylene tetrahydromethanopterin reductase-like flavin-dependent oxidoreductase (luciferase family)
MDVAIGLPSTIRGVGRDQLLEWARRAEARGFSSLGTIDRIVYDNYEPLIALAAAAAVTERIRLATTILIAPYRANGALVAKQAASVDRLSNGRLVLGVAVGGREDDYDASGVDFHARGRRFEQMLEQWQAIWAGESFGTAGAIGPRPPRGRPTLLLGGTADVAFERAARYGDGWVMGGGAPDQFAEGAAKTRTAWEAAGREGAPRTMALATSRSVTALSRRPTATFATTTPSSGSMRA